MGPFHRDRGCYHTVSHWMKKIGLKWHLQPKGGGKGEWKENYPEKMTDARVYVGGGSGGCGGGFWLNQLDRILAEEKPGDQTSQERW